jgi:hypothetical protein
MKEWFRCERIRTVFCWWFLEEGQPFRAALGLWLSAVLQGTEETKLITRCGSIRVVGRAALLHWRSCVDAWDRAQCE